MKRETKTFWDYPVGSNAVITQKTIRKTRKIMKNSTGSATFIYIVKKETENPPPNQ